jgi:hypothetical protein
MFPALVRCPNRASECALRRHGQASWCVRALYTVSGASCGGGDRRRNAEATPSDIIDMDRRRGLPAAHNTGRNPGTGGCAATPRRTRGVLDLLPEPG